MGQTGQALADSDTKMIIDDEEEYRSSSSGSEAESHHDEPQEITCPVLPVGQAPSEHLSGQSTPAEGLRGPTTMMARAYQQEMFEESLKRNIIVTMDTGSGKTQVAVLRIKEELARSEKRVWFLAPTVALADQQHGVLQAQIAGLQSRLICGSDNVEAWSDQDIWDAALYNIRVVVSTFQILFDAVSHGFVRLDSLSLIVIDEAHHCVKKQSIARLMRELYGRDRERGLDVPHIMGLTASPLMRSNFDDLYTLENTLGAICKSPQRHRKELMAKVNRPQMYTVRYPEPLDPAVASTLPPTRSMANLSRVFRELDIKQDPEVVHLRAEKTERSRARLRKIIQTHSTYCRNRVKSFCNLATAIYAELGPWAADYYIHKVIQRFLASYTAPADDLLAELSEETKKYLAEAFQRVDARPPPPVPGELSPKAEKLVEVIHGHRQKDAVGIVFVKERATVAVLTHLLSVHPLTADRYRVGSMVGTSTRLGRQQDFLGLTCKEDIYSLQDFRVGKTNLLVATNVLEEGIDVPECNLVVCFDEPKSPKSFIQRRGRARMSSSYLYLVIPETSSKTADAWKAFEEEMKRLYEDDMRSKKAVEELEKLENSDYPVLEDEITGARLTIDDAKRHLEHFCTTLSSQRFIDSSPYYIIESIDGKPVNPDESCLLKAAVHLPPFLVPELRRFESLQSWYSQEYAMKDAAFQAYSKLREVGLVNRNLLPVHMSDLVLGPEARDGIAEVSEQMNPWIDISQKWQRADGSLFHRRLSLSNQVGSMSVDIDVVLPAEIPHMEPFTVYWDALSKWEVTMSASHRQTKMTDSHVDHTYTLLSMAFGHRGGWTNAEKQYPLRVISIGRDVSLDDISALEFDPESMEGTGRGQLVRDFTNSNHPYIYQEWLPNRPPLELVRRLYKPKPPVSVPEANPADIPYVVVRDWPKRIGSFRPIEPSTQASESRARPYHRIHPAELVKADSIPAVYAHVGMLIPAIAHALETHMVASDLMRGPLESVDIGELSLVLTAITATSARGPTDYERVEFLGDSILKFYTTINVSAKFLIFPEGCLSRYKDLIVSNSRLFRAATEFGLDRYIITKMYSVQKPVYVEDLVEISPIDQMKKRRKLSTKTVADVVESLIGISYIDGGLDKALACTSLLLPDKKMKWQSIDNCRRILFNNAPDNMGIPLTMRRVEELIGYTFKKKSLLVEALTHGSYNVPGVVACLDRLEFLGDALLDYVVVTALFDTPGLKNSDMHLLKTALVNADILGFLVMEWVVEEERAEIEVLTAAGEPIVDEDTTEVRNREGTQVRMKSVMVKHALWSFLRHLSPDMGVVQQATQKRHKMMRDEIIKMLRTGSHYPWALLAKLQVQKFYSDVFESILGAVWVDSGNMEECKAIVRRAGILPLMERLLADRVHIVHPKEELGRLAVSEKVEYVVEVQNEGDEAEKEIVCRVTVGGRCLAEVKGGTTREEARTRAAEVACMVMKGTWVGDMES